MAITVLTGRASHIEHHGERTLRSDGTAVVTAHIFSFRIDNHPTAMKFRESVSLGDGDDVTAAGEDKNGTFHAHAFRNETTGVTHNSRATFMKMSGWALIILGVLLLIILVGFLFLAAGIWAVWLGGKQSASNHALSAVPRRNALKSA